MTLRITPRSLPKMRECISRWQIGFWSRSPLFQSWSPLPIALRLHPDAQPEIQELARCMKAAMDASEPKFCDPGDWHLPYITGPYPDDVEQAKLISAARCARVSYLNHDQSEPDTTKDLALAERLAESGHWSPFEHQAAPLSYHRWLGGSWETGVTHVDRDRNLWSGNLRGWVQHRCLKAAE